MKLFVVSPDCAPGDQRLEINGQGWGLLEQEIPNTADESADFICVSYSWGTGRSPSPFHPPHEVSDRTLPVLATTIAQRPNARKIWIDAFCVPSPSEPSLRASTLQSMGFIYSRASEVVVVLTSEALPVIQQALLSIPLTPAHLDILEAQDWMTRAWTYQETVNARSLCITCDSDSLPPCTSVLIDVMDFFNRLGHSLALLPPRERTRYPRLNALEELLSDYKIAAYLGRSALQVMRVMDERSQTVPEDHFYAMMGAISTELAKAVEGMSPCGAFMALCERKGDYSFVFSSEARDDREGKRWRPREGDLRPIIKLPSCGEGLKGREWDGCLVLDKMVVIGLGTPGPNVRAFIGRWLVGFEEFGAWPDLQPEQAAFEALRTLGFSGSSAYLATEYGLFFPQSPVPRSVDVEILIAIEMIWTLGAPALVRYRDNSSLDEFSYLPGVFFGQIWGPAYVKTSVWLR